MSRLFPLLFVVALFVFGLTLSPIAPTAMSDDAGSLAAAKCSACHNPGRICSKMGQKDAGWWQSTVARMKRNGASISDADIEQISGWLAGQSGAAAPLCE